jgi:hypothetical protein
MVGTSSATIVSLPQGRAHTFENAGLSLEQMERSPRRYVASCSSIASLEVRGPAYLAYWPPSSARPTPRGRTELLGCDALASFASLHDIAPAEEEAGPLNEPPEVTDPLATAGSHSPELPARVEKTRRGDRPGLQAFSGAFSYVSLFP